MKKLIFFLICVVCLFIIQGLVRSIVTLWEKQDLLIVKQKELSRVKSEQGKLKEQAKAVNDPSFIEEESRNKLFLVKPNESVVILPKDALSDKKTGKLEKPKPTLPAYQQWISLLVSGTAKQER